MSKKKGHRESTKEKKMTEREQQRATEVYKRVDSLMELRNKKWRQFNNRTLEEYINDCEKRLNAHVPSKESQGKEDWQSNVALPTVRDKMKRVVAGYSLNVPDLDIEARNPSGDLDLSSIKRSDLAEKMIKSSYMEYENPVIQNFWEAWECAAKGTVIKYEGYMDSKVEQKYIKSYDLESGKVETDTRMVNVEDKLISYLVPLHELYISNYNTHEIQEQDEIAWIQYYTREKFEREFGNYKNSDIVKTTGGKHNTQGTFYNKDYWDGRTNEERIEVVRYYSKQRDEYSIVANGVLILDVPILWTFNEKKIYPFAKSILEPFAGKDFFYGKSFPDIMMGQYDLLNTWFNTIMDKAAMSVDPPMLIGMANRDMFELENEYLGIESNKLYVEDVSQVTPMPVQQVTQADTAMIEMLSRGIEDAVPSLPHLMQQKEATAREVVLTQERLQEMSTIYHETLIDLWRQKYQIRLSNILTHYANPKTVVEDGEEQEIYKTFVIDNEVLDEETGEVGKLAVEFRRTEDVDESEMKRELEAKRDAMKKMGINYKKKVLDPKKFDSYKYKITVSPQDLKRESLAEKQAMLVEELQLVGNFFPEVMMANAEEYIRKIADAYEADADKLLSNYRQMRDEQQGQGGEEQIMQELMEEAEGEGAPQAPQEGQGGIPGPGGELPMM